MLFLMLTTVMAMAGPQTAASAQSLLPAIRQQIRLEGHAEIVMTLNYPPTDLDDLTAKSDLIVEAVTGPCRSYFTRDESRVFTDCTMAVRTVLKGAVTEGAAVTVRRNGGALTVDGANVVVREDAFPAFTRGDRYVLFLASFEGSYIVAHGADGAFKVSDERVRQVIDGAWNERHAGMPVSEFHRLVRSKIK